MPDGNPETSDTGFSPAAAGYVIYQPGPSDYRIAGLTLLDRQLIALHRAGCQSLTIVSEESVSLPPRTQTLGIKIRIAPKLPQQDENCVVADSGAFFQPEDLEQLTEPNTRIETEDGTTLKVLKLKRPSDWHQEWEKDLPKKRTNTRAKNLTSEQAARHLGDQLLKGTNNPNDSWVDRLLNRPLSRYLTRSLVERSFSPTLVSLGAILVGVLGGLLLAIPRQEFAVLGALLFQFSAILDCADGDLARLQFKESMLGKWLDMVGDQIVHIAIFLGIGFGLVRATPSLAITLLTASAVVGAIVAFGTYVWASKRITQLPLLDRLFKIVMNRDISVLVLALACIGRLDIFAWLVGIGIHAYWISLLVFSLKAAAPAHPNAPQDLPALSIGEPSANEAPRPKETKTEAAQLPPK